jgi:hypothetical protein
VAQLGVRTLPVDVWLDARGLVRRLHLVIGAEKTTIPAAMDLTVDFSAFGTPVDAAPPPDAQTLDVTGTAASGLRLLG